MDWILTWLDLHFLAGMLSAIAMFWLGRNWEGWLMTLYRKWRRMRRPKCPNCGTILGYNGQCLVCWQRELWPQPTSPPPSALDALTEIQAKMSNVTEAEATAALNLDAEFPQPTSQQQSESTIGLTSGPSQLSDASLDSANWPQAARENED